MTEQQLRDNAAALAWDIRSIKRKGDWTIREWNHKVRGAIRAYMDHIRIFHRTNPV